MIKTKVALWIQIALIGWIKAGPPKKPLLLWSCKQANCNQKIGKIMNFFSQFEWLDALKWPKKLISVSLVLVQKTTNGIGIFWISKKKYFSAHLMVYLNLRLTRLMEKK